jgi:hypothetical protein
MKIKDILALMYEAEEAQLVCIQDVEEHHYFIGTVADLRRQGQIDIPILTMFTEMYPAYGKSGLTIVI